MLCTCKRQGNNKITTGFWIKIWQYGALMNCSHELFMRAPYYKIFSCTAVKVLTPILGLYFVHRGFLSICWCTFSPLYENKHLTLRKKSNLKTKRLLFLKIDQEQNLPNPLLSSVTTRSNITDTICLTVAAAVVQIVASFMKYNLKHKTMA